MECVSNQRCFDGQQKRFRHRSAVLDCDMHFSLYMPPQAELEAVPVLFWLSGLTCTDENFVQKAGAQRIAAKHGVALLAPDTSPRGDAVSDDPDGAYDLGLGAGFYLDAVESPWSDHYHMESYICGELPDLVFNEFSLDRQRCGVFGHSMGGHGALTLGFKHPRLFRSISAFAPIVAPMQCPWGIKALTAYLGTDRELWRRHDSCALIEDGAELPAEILVDQGAADNFLHEQLKPELLQNALADTDCVLHLRWQAAYDHSYFFIASFIEEHIGFHRRQLIKPAG